MPSPEREPQRPDWIPDWEEWPVSKATAEKWLAEYRRYQEGERSDDYGDYGEDFAHLLMTVIWLYEKAESDAQP